MLGACMRSGLAELFANPVELHWATGRSGRLEAAAAARDVGTAAGE